MIHRYVSSPTRNETVPCVSIRSHQMEKQLYGKRKPFLRENFLIISMERAIKLDWQNYQELFESIIYRMQILSSLFFLVISLISLTRFFVSNFKLGRSTFDFNCSRNQFVSNLASTTVCNLMIRYLNEYNNNGSTRFEIYIYTHEQCFSSLSISRNCYNKNLDSVHATCSEVLIKELTFGSKV